MTDEEKTAQAAHIASTYGIEMDQIYIDNDPREGGTRFIRVLSTVSKPNKACCASCARDGSIPGRTLWISFERLSNKRLYTRIGMAGHANRG